uniref:Uncharacterized protein n=1 Tax=Photinus pyralis TaxID=7054 RepID=A0A1Y1KMP8_PHOPY
MKADKFDAFERKIPEVSNNNKNKISPSLFVRLSHNHVQLEIRDKTTTAPMLRVNRFSSHLLLPNCTIFLLKFPFLIYPNNDNMIVSDGILSSLSPKTPVTTAFALYHGYENMIKIK